MSKIDPDQLLTTRIGGKGELFQTCIEGINNEQITVPVEGEAPGKYGFRRQTADDAPEIIGADSKNAMVHQIGNEQISIAIDKYARWTSQSYTST